MSSLPERWRRRWPEEEAVSSTLELRSLSRSLRSLRPVKAAFHIVAVCGFDLVDCHQSSSCAASCRGLARRFVAVFVGYSHAPVAQDSSFNSSSIQRGRKRPSQAISRLVSGIVSLYPSRMYRYTSRCHYIQASRSCSRKQPSRDGSAKIDLHAACTTHHAKVGLQLYVCGSSSTAVWAWKELVAEMYLWLERSTVFSAFSSVLSSWHTSRLSGSEAF